MGSAFKYALISFVINIVVAALIYLPLIFFSRGGSAILLPLLLFWPLSLFIQLIVGLAYLAGNSEKGKNIGKGMLLTVGVFFVIGLSVCGMMTM